MSATQTQPAASFGAKIGTFATGALFALVLMLANLLRLRNNPRAWFVFRVLLGAAGAALVVVPLGLWNSWILAVLGLTMFITAALLSPAPPMTATDDKARELGALVVVNGGIYQPGSARPTAAKLFSSAEYIWALDANLRTLLVIPVAEICEVRISQTPGAGPNRWRLRIKGLEDAAEFAYHGFFAEHFARVAQSTIQSLLPATPPVIQPQPQTEEAPLRRRAAGA